MKMYLYERHFNQVIILGAGASKSDGAPLQRELFSEFFKYRKKGLWSIPEETDELIVKFFKDFWGINISSFNERDVKFPTFEECLGVLDLARFQGDSFKGYTQDKIDKIRNALIFLIAKILDEKLRNETKYHKILVNTLKSRGILKETAFLSLNYDIIIDNVLTQSCPDFHLDYGIGFINFYRDDSNWKKPDSNKSILLLKLHGSLNWLLCPTCNHLELTPKEKGAIKAFYNLKKCEICNSLMKPVIIPPSFYKEISNPFIQQIFLKAYYVLRQVDKIFFCGYSFPDADLHIKYLLKKAEMFKGETPDIYVINSYPNKPESQKREEKTRYMRFFKDKEKIHYKNLSFEEFCEDHHDLFS
ncbi:hypothetical protein CW705_07840 [Candidatus Bathyarchaeota archaeon]|nr:MAG: hypothetical protein CW705_07840 [Candidatus Bathyarchaeota archaeon]